MNALQEPEPAPTTHFVREALCADCGITIPPDGGRSYVGTAQPESPSGESYPLFRCMACEAKRRQPHRPAHQSGNAGTSDTILERDRLRAEVKRLREWIADHDATASNLTESLATTKRVTTALMDERKRHAETLHVFENFVKDVSDGAQFDAEFIRKTLARIRWEYPENRLQG